MKGTRKKYGKKYVVCHPSIVEEVKKRTTLEVRGSYGVRPGHVFLCRKAESQKRTD